MPNIREYGNSANISPDNTSAQAAFFAGQSTARSAQAVESDVKEMGRDVGSLVQDAGHAYVKHRTSMEVSQGLAAYANINDYLGKKWDEVAKEADPNDPTTADRFRQEDLEPTLSKWVEGFSTEDGKKWAESQAGSLRQHMFERTAADQSTLAGLAAVSNLDTFSNRMSSNVQRDPSGLDAALGAVDQGVEAIVASQPNLDATQAAKLRTELTANMKTSLSRAAVVGMADINPDQAISALATDRFDSYLSAGEKATLKNYAEGVKTTAAQVQKTAASEDRRVKNEYATRISSRISAAMLGNDGTTVVTPDIIRAVKAYAQLPEADPGQVRAMTNMIDTTVKEQAREARAPTTDDPQTYQDFAARMSLPKGDPRRLSETEVYNARARGDITTETMNFLVKARGADDRDAKATQTDQVWQKARNELVNSMKPYFNPGTDGQGAEGLFARREYEFAKQVDRVIDHQLSLGKTMEEIERDYLDPRGKGYLGTLVPQFVPSTKDVDTFLDNPGMSLPPVDIRRGEAAAAPPAPRVQAPARLPGESAAAYLARTK